MTRDQIELLCRNIQASTGDWKPEESILLRHDAEQRRVIDELRQELNDTWVDDHGTTWSRPTAWAYSQVCKARDTWQRQAEQQAQQIATLREALENCLAQIHDDIKQCGPCEHDVNICVCPLKILAAEAQQAIKEVS